MIHPTTTIPTVRCGVCDVLLVAFRRCASCREPVCAKHLGVTMCTLCIEDLVAKQETHA